jgi:hypothetical protein
MKGYGNVVKAFFTKYGDVLRHKRVPGLRVKWETINVMAAEPIMMRYINQIAGVINNLHAGIREEDSRRNLEYGPGEEHRNFDANHRGVHGMHMATNQALPSPHDINAALDAAIYPDRERSTEDLEAEFDHIRAQAIEAADISSYKKYIDNFMAIGNKRYQADLKLVENLKRELAKQKGDHAAGGVSSIHTEIRRCLNAEIEVINLCTHAMTTAAKRMQSQSISACRKAIMHHATEGNGASYADEGYTSAADEYFDNFMGNLGY